MKTTHIFDLVFKQLMHLSSEAIVQFINGLFGTDFPIDSTVEYPNTELITGKLRKLIPDTVIIIDDIHVYHIEAQISNDENMAVRVFEYGFYEGLRTKTIQDGKITIKFPHAKVIYWETTKKTPATEILCLEFSDGKQYDYEVSALKFLDYSIQDIEKHKLAILLPFYVLKLRKQVVAAKDSVERKKLSVQMTEILDELAATSERCAKAGLMTETDMHRVIEFVDMLFVGIYKDYTEFQEVDTMLQERILTYSEIAAAKAEKQGAATALKTTAKNLLKIGMPIEQIIQVTGLPLKSVQSLTKQP